MIYCPHTREARPTRLADAIFTEDMAETLFAHFERYSVNGRVTVEVTDQGLWLRNPVGGRHFLGATERLSLNTPI